MDKYRSIILIWLAGSLFWLLSLTPAAAATVTATGGWTLSVTSSNLTGGAGSDLTATYTSTANASIIAVSGSGGGSWQVYISRADTNWPAAFILQAQRTSSGSGSGGISGGTSYQIINTGIGPFFSGTRNRTGINIRYQLSGVSISVPPGSYSTTVIYTITP